MAFDGSNLIFLISQPRSGSTMLQRILGSHPQIHTVAEPWIMLHPIYAMRSKGIFAEYDSSLAYQALQEFWKELPKGREDYLNGLREMADHLYSRALYGTGKSYFLDKTPRYYLIIEELGELFSEAKFVFLLRNPMAVLSSIMHTWVNSHLLNLHNYKGDLLVAPYCILNGIDRLGDRANVIHYENLVKTPRKEVRDLCKAIDLPFQTQMINYGGKGFPDWSFGDSYEVNVRESPTSANVEKWVSHISNPQIWRLCKEYLSALSSPIVERIGYSYSDVLDILQRNRPCRASLINTFSFNFLMAKSVNERSRFSRYFIHSIALYNHQGLGEMVKVIKHKIANKAQK
jgi:hypothetical protein